MQIVTGELKGHTNEYPLSRLGKREEILALDIETTGLAPDRSRVWLIGCAYWEEGSWRQIQWFDETGNDEADILTSFLLFSKRFRVLLTYNGDTFDLPFLTRRIIHHGLQAMSGAERFPSSMRSMDLLRFLRPYKEILSLPNLQQQTMERFAATGRTESLTGLDLADRYLAYIAGAPIMADTGTFYAEADSGQNTIPATDISGANASSAPTVLSRRDVRAQFLAHNAADTAGLLSLSDLLIYSDLFAAELTVYKAQANVCRDAFGNPSQELLLYARMKSLPAGTGEVLSRKETARERSDKSDPPSISAQTASSEITSSAETASANTTGSAENAPAEKAGSAETVPAENTGSAETAPAENSGSAETAPAETIAPDSTDAQDGPQNSPASFAAAAKDSVPVSDPFRITTQADSCYLAIRGSRVTIRIPIFSGRLHYYYANYKDYYYLPELDQAIHKSIAAFVDRDRRVQATRETCYTSKDGSFLPEWTRLHEPYYRKESRDRTVWFEFTPELKRSREFFTEYANYIYRHIVEAQIS